MSDDDRLRTPAASLSREGLRAAARGVAGLRHGTRPRSGIVRQIDDIVPSGWDAHTRLVLGATYVRPAALSLVSHGDW